MGRSTLLPLRQKEGELVRGLPQISRLGETGLQLLIRLGHRKLREFFRQMIGRPEKESGVGFAEHRRVVISVAGGHGKEVQRLEGGDGMFFLIRHPHVVRHDAAASVDFKLVAE